MKTACLVCDYYSTGMWIIRNGDGKDHLKPFLVRVMFFLDLMACLKHSIQYKYF